MPIFKHVWNFSSTPGGEWSEVHHQEVLTIAAARSTINDGLVNARLECLDDCNTLDSIDILPVHPGGAGQEVPQGKDGLATPGSADHGPANLGEAARISLAGLVSGRRKLWMRGIPENYLERNPNTGKTRVLPLFKTQLETLIQLWAAAGYGILTRTRKAPMLLASGPKPILKLQYNANGTTSLFLSGSGSSIAIGDEIVVGGLSPRFFPYLNGVYTVQSNDAMSWQIKHAGLPHAVDVPTPGGYVFKCTWTVRVYDKDQKANPVLTTRQTKNEDTGSRGARSARGGRA